MVSTLSKEERRAKRRARRERREAARLKAAAELTKVDSAAVKKAAQVNERVADAMVPFKSGFSKATNPDKGGYAVFANANRRSALRCPLDGGGMVEFIPMSDDTLKMESCTEMFFNTLWERTDYDPKRAAAAYAAAAKWRGITEEAKMHLERLLGTPLKNVKTQTTEVKSRSNEAMKKRTSHSSSIQTAVLSVTNESATSAPAEQPGGGATTTAATPPKKNKGMKKPAAPKKVKAKAKAAPKKGAKKADAAAPTGKRAFMHAMKIKVLQPKNPKREGTAAWKKYEVYKTAKTVGEALEKGEKVGFRMSTINYDVKHKFIQLVKP